MRTVRLLLAAAALLALVRPTPAVAHPHAQIGLGADYLVDPQDGELQLTLAVDTHLTRHVTVGARFGGMYVAEPGRFGAPIDGRLRIRSGRVYAEGLVGPWLVFDDGDVIRLHAAFGFGLMTRSLAFGFEVGWLGHDPNTSMVGVRVAFNL